jgi:phage gp29-like protein
MNYEESAVDRAAKLAENTWQVVTGVDDVTDCITECLDRDDAITHAFTECELSGDQMDELDDNEYVAWTDVTGTNWVRIEPINRAASAR